jgi:hypothetical protein
VNGDETELALTRSRDPNDAGDVAMFELGGPRERVLTHENGSPFQEERALGVTGSNSIKASVTRPVANRPVGCGLNGQKLGIMECHKYDLFGGRYVQRS